MASGRVQWEGFKFDQLRRKLKEREHIRNICVVSHINHGKTTLTDSLVAKAGIIANEMVGDCCSDAREDEMRMRMTIKSSNISLYYDIPEAEGDEDNKYAGQSYLVNVIDCPGHSDFRGEVTAALRVTDGTVVVVDCVEGVCIQTESVLKQALTERVQPVLMINKMDLAIVEFNYEAEDCYNSFRRIIEEVNVVMALYGDQALVRIDPAQGNVAFGSGLQGWAFTLAKFAHLYAKKFGVKKDKLMKKFWGDNYFDSKSKKWITSMEGLDGTILPRAWCQFVFKPIQQLINAIMNDDIEKYTKMIKQLNIRLTRDENTHAGKALLKAVMRKFLPAGDALLEMIILNLPSPLVAQKYRVENLYTGDMDDVAATAIKNCDPNGPLMMYVSKMIPTPDKGRFMAFGRVFSGTIRAGQKVRILGPNYEKGRKNDLFIKPVQRLIMTMGRFESMDECPCGTTVAVIGIDQYLLREGTLTTDETASKMGGIKCSVAPVIQVAVEPRQAKDLPKLVEGLKRLSKTDPSIEVSTNDAGEHIIAGHGELHLQICLRDLEEEIAQIPVKKSFPIISYRETVSDTSSQTCLAKSPNKHNRLYGKAEPLTYELCDEIEAGKMREFDSDSRARARYLATDHEWDEIEARKIWAFGPDLKGANILVMNTPYPIQNVDEIKDSCIAAWQWVTRQGVLCEEPMRGVRLNILDVTMNADCIHRGGGQIIPTARRLSFASVLTAKPRLQEPLYLAEIQCTETSIGHIFSQFNQRRGVIIEEEQRPGSNLHTIKGYVPVMESFGLKDALSKHTSRVEMVFDHWEILPGDPLEEGTQAQLILNTLRQRKGLTRDIALDRYLDRL